MPSENWKLAEMEFYLVDDLECDLTVFHPYRTLMALCTRKPKSSSDSQNFDSSSPFQAEAGELGAGVGAEGSAKYWGNKSARIELPEAALQMAWLMINDTYRSDMCLIYPPHIIAVAVLTFTLALHGPAEDAKAAKAASSQGQESEPRRSSRRSGGNSNGQTQIYTMANRAEFLAGLNVSMSLVTTVIQEIISLYALWENYDDDSPPEAGIGGGLTAGGSGDKSTGATSAAPTPAATTPAESLFDRSEQDVEEHEQEKEKVTPTQLVRQLVGMHDLRVVMSRHPRGGHVLEFPKALERIGYN
jgi:cyclin C